MGKRRSESDASSSSEFKKQKNGPAPNAPTISGLDYVQKNLADNGKSSSDDEPYPLTPGRAGSGVPATAAFAAGSLKNPLVAKKKAKAKKKARKLKKLLAASRATHLMSPSCSSDMASVSSAPSVASEEVQQLRSELTRVNSIVEFLMKERNGPRPETSDPSLPSNFVAPHPPVPILPSAFPQPATLPSLPPSTSTLPQTLPMPPLLPPSFFTPPALPQTSAHGASSELPSAQQYLPSRCSVAFSSGLLAGEQLPDKLKHKIWNEEYVDFFEIWNVGTEAYTITSNSTDKPAMSLLPGKKFVLSKEEWSKAFDDYMSVYIRKFPDATHELIAYGAFVRELMVRGSDWALYDQSFRKDRAITKCSWGLLRVDLYLKANSTSPKDPRSDGNGKARFFRGDKNNLPAGYCFNYHDAQKRCLNRMCTYKHSCPKCNQFHPTYFHSSNQPRNSWRNGFQSRSRQESSSDHFGHDRRSGRENYWHDKRSDREQKHRSPNSTHSRQAKPSKDAS